MPSFYTIKGLVIVMSPNNHSNTINTSRTLNRIGIPSFCRIKGLVIIKSCNKHSKTINTRRALILFYFLPNNSINLLIACFLILCVTFTSK